MSCALCWVMGEILDVGYIVCRSNFLFYEDIWAGALFYYATTSKIVLVALFLGWRGGGGVASAPCFRARELLQVKFTYFIPKQ